MRWRWPPENACGNRRRCSTLSLHRAATSRTRSSISARVLARPMAWSGSATMSRTVIRGLSEEYGSWKMSCMWRRNFLSSPRPQGRQVDLVAVQSKRDASRGGRHGAQHGPADRGLARARLADQTEGLALAYLEADPVDRLHHPGCLGKDALAAHREVDLEALDPDERVLVHGTAGSAWRWQLTTCRPSIRVTPGHLQFAAVRDPARATRMERASRRVD